MSPRRLLLTVAIATASVLGLAPIVVARGTARNISATEGSEFSGVVADYSCDCSPTSATIDWGDGSSSEGEISGGSSGTVRGKHTYTQAGSYELRVRVVDDSSGFDETYIGTATVSEAPPRGGRGGGGGRSDGGDNPPDSDGAPPAAPAPAGVIPSAAFTVSPPGPRADDRIFLEAWPSQISPRMSSYDWAIDGLNVSCGERSLLEISGLAAGSHVISLRVTDVAGAQATTSKKITVAPSPPGPRARSSLFSSLCRREYDLRVKGIEVTQAIQMQDSTAPGGQLPTYLPGKPAPVFNHGVFLAEHSKTVARVFAESLNGSVSGAVAMLRAYDHHDGHELSGGPLLPQYGPGTLGESDCRCVTLAERSNPDSAYTYVLPDAWAHGVIDLRAELIPPARSLRDRLRGAQECSTGDCLANNRFHLKFISFLSTPEIYINPIRVMTKGQASLPDPGSVFAAARTVIPGGERIIVGPYSGDVDPERITTIAGWSRKSTECAGYLPDKTEDGKDHFIDCKNDAYFAEVNKFSIPDVVVGVNAQERGIAWQVEPVDWSDRPPVALVEISRPLTSVAHELGHNLGRPHAGTETECSGGGGVSWPPDDRGYIQGIGLDRRFSRQAYRPPQGTLRSSVLSRFPIIAPVPSGEYGGGFPYYDLMSYCADNDETNGTNAWTSVPFWNADLFSLSRFGDKVGFGPRVFTPSVNAVVGTAAQGADARALSTSSRALHVQAQVTAGGAQLTLVEPVTGGSRPPGSSPYHAIVRDAAGAVISDTPMLVRHGHADRPLSEFDSLEADFPASGAASVTITANGRPIVARTRSPHAPAVRILAPHGGQRVGLGSAVTVSWKATDADGDRLGATVDYSLDDGRRWRTVSAGSQDGQATLPAHYFAQSARARVRVRVNDGFNETVAESPRFTALGSAPTVRILSPLAHEAAADASALYLRGEAFDDRLQPILGQRLAWYDGRRLLGRGASVSATGLAPGRRRIRLVATDSSGRRGSRAVTVQIRGTAPVLLSLKAPRSLSHRAHRLTLRLSASLPATLSIGSQRFTVGRTPRNVRLTVRRGQRPLALSLRLTAYGRSSTSLLSVRRR